jgi:hypothetical protein
VARPACRRGRLSRHEFATGEVARLLQQRDDLGRSPSGPVVPGGEISDPAEADRRRRAPVDPFVAAPVQRVPGHREGAMDELTRGGGRPAGGLHHRTDQAPTVGGDPPALHPLSCDDDLGIGQQGLDVVQLGDRGAAAILFPKTTSLPHDALPPPSS